MEEDFVGELIGLVFLVAMLLFAFSIGSIRARMHERSLRKSEEELAHVFITDVRRFASPDETRGGTLVVATVCLSADYFKTFLAGFRRLLGGELRMYRALMERCRRQALVRICEQAHGQGFDAICNVRLETADLGLLSTNNQATMVAVVATGTAYKRREEVG